MAVFELLPQDIDFLSVLRVQVHRAACGRKRARDNGLPVVAKVPEQGRAETARLLEAGVTGIQLPVDLGTLTR